MKIGVQGIMTVSLLDARPPPIIDHRMSKVWWTNMMITLRVMNTAIRLKILAPSTAQVEDIPLLSPASAPIMTKTSTPTWLEIGRTAQRFGTETTVI